MILSLSALSQTLHVYVCSLERKKENACTMLHIYTYVHRTYKASGRNANATTAPYNERRSTASRVPKWMTGNVWTPLAAAANTNERLLTLSAAATTLTRRIRGHEYTQRAERASLFFSQSVLLRLGSQFVESRASTGRGDSLFPYIEETNNG